MTYRRAAVLLVASLLVLPAAAQRVPRRTRPIINPLAQWKAPSCGIVDGLPSVRFVRDDTSVAANREHVVNLSASSIAASNRPNVLYATYQEHLFESRDSGCTWRERAHLGPAPQAPWTIAHARTERIYVHDMETLLRVTPYGVERLPLPARMLEVFANPRQPLHLRALGFDGATFESADGGDTWSALGTSGTRLYSVAVDPANFDHLVAAAWRDGVSVSFDGGRTWTRTGQLKGINTFYTEFSAADPRVVWAVGISVADGVDRLYRSIDGGMTFAPVLVSGRDLQFSRADLAPSPRDANVVAFRASGGVALFDASKGTASLVAQAAPSALTWSPAGTLYFATPDEVIITN